MTRIIVSQTVSLACGHYTCYNLAMHRVVPELIIENYRAGKFSGEFPAIGMFLDLSGFSTMTDTLMQHGQHGAEVLANLMHGVFDPLVESIFSYGGKIVGFAGDGIMALYPIEGDAKSIALGALASAWVVQSRLVESGQRRTVYGSFQFTAKIGLSYGSVSWGILHSEDRKNATYFFRGSAVEASASAEHHALAGEILITEELNSLLGDMILTKPLPSLHRLLGFNTELPFTTPTTLPPIDQEISRIFVPEEIVAQDLPGEFRQVVNLFIRFPEIMNEQLGNVMRVIFQLHKKYGGLLNRIDFGDKGCNILILWGAPVAYENDIGRALNFVLDLRSRIDIPVTAGLTYYIAHAGYLGSVMCEDYTCYGWGVNLASRLMMSAPLGEIWVDDRIARRVSSRFVLESIGEQRFKGFSAIQQVHRLKHYNRDLEVHYLGEMVGRERELARLEKFVEPLWKGDFAGVILILGDAGIGKGRLVEAFRWSHLFEERSATWAFCQSEQILRQSFNPFRSWLFRYFGFTSSQDFDERRNIFNSKINDLIGAIPESELTHDLDRLRSVLAALVDLFWPDSLYEQSDAEARYNSTLLVLTSLIKAESLRQPFILFVEDVQFIDEDSLSFLPRLRRAIFASDEFFPVGIIATSRIQKHNPFLSTDIVDEEIQLGGLPREAVARFVEILLGGVPSLDLVNLVMDRSEGNPYFVEQIIRYLQDEDMIEMSLLGWKHVERVRESFLPGDIGAVLVARLDQLSRKVKEVVQTASVFGREFLLEVLKALMTDGEEIQQYVDEAEQYSIWIGLNNNHYMYTHGLLRDTAYSMQMRSRRQELHSRALIALEKIYGDEKRLHYAELAYHAELGDLRDKAQHYYALAGNAAAEAYQNKKGIEYLTRALSFTPLRDMADQFDLLVERVELFNRIGDRAAQLKDLQILEILAQEMKDQLRLINTKILHAKYAFTTGDYPDTIDVSRQVVELSRESNQPEIALGVFIVWSQALFRLGRHEEARKHGLEGLELAKSLGSRLDEGRSLSSLGLIALESKEPRTAQKYLEEAVSIARETKERTFEARALANLANATAFGEQDYSTARKYYEQSYLLNVELGDRYFQCIALGNIGWVCGMLGNIADAQKYHELALIIAREVGNIYQETYTLMNLSRIAEIQGISEDALKYARSAMELSQRFGDKNAEAWSYLYLGHAYSLMALFEEAKFAFQEGLSIRRELGQSSLATEPIAGLIQTAIQTNDVVLARMFIEELTDYLSSGDALDAVEEPLRVYLACYQGLERIEDLRSIQILDKARLLLDEQVSKINDEKARRMYIENVPWRRAIETAWQTKKAKS